VLRYEGEHPERAGIRAESGYLKQRTVNARREASPKGGQTIEVAELGQVVQKFDVLGEGQQQLPR
jgi:hypothetical protein